jgi:hypothetical protein
MGIRVGVVERHARAEPRRHQTRGIPADGSVHGYAEQYGSGCGCEYAKIDGTVWITTSWNPRSYWQYPFQPQLNGEANYTASDIPGTSGAPTQWADMQGQNGSDHQFYNWACNGFLVRSAPSSNRWSFAYTSCPSFEIYT